MIASRHFTPAPTVATTQPTPIRLFDESDHPWIAEVVDLVVASQGEPWRVMLERLAHSRIAPARARAIVHALRRVTGGRADRLRVARQMRALVLGLPALSRADRDARLAAAAAPLGLDGRGVGELLWIDLAAERPVTLPSGRPSERELAAFANLDRIQRALRRARSLRLRLWSDAHVLVRTAARYGLLLTATRSDGAIQLDIAGPLALFHDTAVYGRSLAGLVPLLVEHPRFELDLEIDLDGSIGNLRVASPALLPPLFHARMSRSATDRIARLLSAAKVVARGIAVERDPSPIEHATALLHPDFAITVPSRGGSERRWLVEVVGFATAEYLADKLARYRAAGIEDVVLYVEHKRLPPGQHDARIVAYRGKLTAEPLLCEIAPDENATEAS